VEEARRKALPIVIDIGFFHQPLFFVAMPESVPDNMDWIRKKRNVVQRFHRSSYAMGLLMKSKGSSLEQRYALSRADFAEHGGGFPIRLEGCGVIGSVTVSGLPQQDDHMLIVRMLCTWMGKDPSQYDISNLTD
jgi:uncharacterized protein (UPF0303 family)